MEGGGRRGGRVVNERQGGKEVAAGSKNSLQTVRNATTGCGKEGFIDRLDFDVASYGNLRRDCCLSCGSP
jgi:hypothetical protein